MPLALQSDVASNRSSESLESFVTREQVLSQCRLVQSIVVAFRSPKRLGEA